MNCKLVLSKRSVFFHNLRYFSNQANDHPTLRNGGKGMKLMTFDHLRRSAKQTLNSFGEGLTTIAAINQQRGDLS